MNKVEALRRKGLLWWRACHIHREFPCLDIYAKNWEGANRKLLEMIDKAHGHMGERGNWTLYIRKGRIAR